MKRKKISLESSQHMVAESYSYLSDDCWEFVFRFIINNKINKLRNLNILSAVCKQFLYVTDRLRFSLTVYDSTCPFLRRLFERFINLNSLNLIRSHRCDLDALLHKMSCFPSLKLTSLKISDQDTFPANGLRAFSQNITTLTSLTCSHIYHDNNELLLIADCFPLLKQLDLSHPFIFDKNHTNFINGMYSLSSKCRFIQHLDLNHTYFLNDQHVAELSLFLAHLVSINLSECRDLTESALFSLVRNCLSLSDIKMECTSIGKRSGENSNSLVEFGVYPQLKFLYLGNNLMLSDENIIMFASSFPNLELLDLNWCDHIYEGICQILRRCCKIRHLNLTGCSRVKLLGINFEVPKLEVLNLSITNVDDEILYAISKNCCGILKLLLNNCDNVTRKGVKHVEKNCTQLREITLGNLK